MLYSDPTANGLADQTSTYYDVYGHTREYTGSYNHFRNAKTVVVKEGEYTYRYRC